MLDSWFCISAVMREIKTTFKTFICSFPDCYASYDREAKLNVHLCKHTGEKPFECKYDGCTKRFCSKFHLTRHGLTHTGEKLYKCEEEGCTKRFTTKSNLKKHVSFQHRLEVKQYICPFEGCAQRFKKNNLLRSHESIHTHQLPYKCSYEDCDRRFLYPSQQKRHEKVHKGYPCPAENCSFTGKNWTELTKHKREQHKEKIQCGECKKTFKDRWYLKSHQQVHSKECMVFYCPREGCTRSYTTAFNLNSHILSFHEEKRAFTCTYPNCGKSFCMRQSLQRHSVVHDPERKKQKKSRPRRSLASHISGHKPRKRKQQKTSDPGEQVHPGSSQSKQSQVETHQKSNPVQNEITTQLQSDQEPATLSSAHPESSPSELEDSESVVILILEPLVLENKPHQAEPLQSNSMDICP